jgi:hypothetical protein
MKGPKAVWFCCILALVSAIGIIGMLLVEEHAEAGFLLLAWAPVIAGCILVRRLRPQ